MIPRAPRTCRAERGSGSVLAVALIGAVVALTALALPLYIGLATRQAVAAAADASALAAADVASGLEPGYPCTAAERAAAGNGAVLVSCGVDGLVATVTVSRSILGVPVVSTATAGPPPFGSGLGISVVGVCMVSLTAAVPLFPST